MANRRDRSTTVAAPAQDAPTSQLPARTGTQTRGTGPSVRRVSVVPRQQPIPQITRFGMVVPPRSRFDAFTLAEVRKVVTRAQQFDQRAATGATLGTSIFTSIYVPGAQVSVSSMDDVALSRLPLWNYIATSRAFLAGDHWQGGAGWAGPWPRAGSNGDAVNTAMTDIANRFVSHNVLGELIDRHVTGVMGREPHWTMTPRRVVTDEAPITTAEQLLIDEANAMLTEWWDKRHAQELLQQATATLLFARRSALRIYIPSGQLMDVLQEDGAVLKMVIVPDVKTALMTLWLDHPAPERSTVTQDDDSKQELGALIYQGGISITGDGQPVEVGELVYVDPATRVTVLRTIDKDADIEWSADLGGRLLMHEMQRPLYLTPQLQQKQRALNLALSMLPRHLVTAGFLERILLNAQMPGHWEKDPTTGDPKGKWVADPVTRGAGVETYIVGVEESKADGSIARKDPQVHDREPVSPEPTLSSIRALYELMLEEGAQAHVLMNADAGASGKSREEARSDYSRSLTTTSPRVEQAGRWVLETLLATAEALAGVPGYYTSQLRAVFNLRMDTGPVDALERTANNESYKAGTMSRETAMARNGIADVDAEVALIDAQPGANLANVERMTTIFVELVREGIAPEQAGRVAGFDEEQIKELVAGFTPPPPPVVDPNAPPVPGSGDGGNNGPAQ